MRNIYGNRSIIPNNYYFTFDKIYENLTDIANNHGDTVLIGRTVLCQQDHTVWLKTVNGYIRVAKLDNEGRFKFLEGYPLTDIHNIDDLTGLGDSPNGNGTYLVNYDKKVQGDYPSIRGIEKSSYLSGITFLLNQYSETFLPETAYQKITSEDEFSKTQTYYILDEKGNYIQQVYTEIDYSTALENNIEIFIKSPIQVKVYQIMTDISSGLKNKQDDNSKREKLYHNNKTFTRQCIYIYKIASGDVDKTKKYYKYDVYENGFQEVINPNVTNGYYTRELSTNWSTWDDLSEQYTGYIGDLDPDYNIKQEDGIERSRFGIVESNKLNNLQNSSTLVDAINTLDNLIGSRRKIGGTRTTVNTPIKGGIDSKLENDSRSYNIPEDNIMDAIVHHDADIGELSRLTNINNIAFTKDKITNLDTDVSDNPSNINSLIDAILVLNALIGNGQLLGNNTLQNTEGNKYKIEAKNIIDALVEHDMNIGELTTIANDNNNIPQTNLVEAINRLNSLIGELNNFNDTDTTTNINWTDDKDASTLTSLVDVIIKLDKLIGDFESSVIGIKDKPDENGNKITTGTKATTIVGAIGEHDKEIGELENLSQTNKLNQEKNLVDIINQLDSFLGVIRNIQTEPENISANTLSDAIVQLDEQISKLKQNIKGLEEYNDRQDSDISSQGTQIQDLYQYLMGDFESERIDDFSAEGINSLSGLVNKLNTNVNQQTNNLNNLAENVNYMDSTIADLANQINAGGTTSGFNWGSF